MEIPILEGREFTHADVKKDPKIVIVNKRFAMHFFGGKSAVGRHLGQGGGPSPKLDSEIIGGRHARHATRIYRPLRRDS